MYITELCEYVCVCAVKIAGNVDEATFCGRGCYFHYLLLLLCCSLFYAFFTCFTFRVRSKRVTE